ncbi:MAG: phosphorylcholine transferase LicD [Suipraeoptans sp.]
MSNDVTKEIQDICKKILKEYIRICDKYELRYYLIDGSMLGAIRHEGFIPWDDDLDIAMPRPDYEKFCSIVKSELPDNMYWVSYEESIKGKSVGEIAQLYCSDIELEMDYFSERKTTNVWMDIMIMYGMPKGSVMQNVHYYFYYLHKGLARMGHIENIGRRKYNLFERMAISLARSLNLSKVLNTEKLLQRATTILKKYSYDESSSIIIVPSEYGKREITLKDSYEPARKSKFEDLYVNVPRLAEQILTNLYGDYLKFPPKEERKSKHKVKILNRVEMRHQR